MPEPVLRKAQDAIWDLDGSGIGILEHSHRGKEFERVLERAEANVRSLARVGSEWDVLFVTGGATTHFAMVPRSFLSRGIADVCHTGVWSGKAIDDARRYGEVRIACTSEATKFDRIPDACTWTAGAKYAHYTSNETIYGTQWRTPPRRDDGVLFVCDASSDIFSRPLATDGHGLIFAGAQKNLGPSGISVVIARRDFIERGEKDLPALEQYRTYAKERSMYNTPSTFGIWMIGEVCAWIADEGGLEAMAARNEKKANVLYDYLDRSDRWRAHAQPGSRSHMNVTFRGATPELEERMLTEAERRGMSGLKGHRSVGGLRASLYNAFPEQGVHQLVEVLDQVL